MWLLIISAILGGSFAFLYAISLEGIEAPVATPASNLLGWGGLALFMIGVLAAIWEIVDAAYSALKLF